MKKLLKPSDEATIEQWHTHDSLALILRAVKEWSDFEIGEVLVKRDLSNNNLVEVSGQCRIPKKWKIVHIDDLGIPWIKVVSVRGGLGNKLEPMTKFQPNRFRFEIDPEKLDALLLGVRYDPRIEYKRMRDANPNYGKKTQTDSDI